ncbi:Hypothetical Protein FCC1311_021472 [Hondaea fermentalgiana]|uniref:PH domain-containing protein n=1 Tax=Hondaea fermentalgiana TaxID=2315210 RepID=A0A2R5G809_9STRA|nr:Hypothetical Protein FCC1311_021472 [Hondaea fermentalgiana]|eukprot:GBG25928.1 Hypothetical Protein FCC1311_021472 [Hondaea fermentalgiana]
MIFWTGWLLKASEDSGKWRKRFFRVRDNKLEYLEGAASEEVLGGGLAQQAAASAMASLVDVASGAASAAVARTHRRAASSSTETDGFDPDEGRKDDSKQGNIRRVKTNESNLSQASSENGGGQAGDDDILASTNSISSQLSNSTTFSSRPRGDTDLKDWAVAREVGEAPRGFINLDEVAGFFVFGRLRTDPVLDHHVRLCSSRHATFHQGKVKLLLCGRPGRPSWRLALGDDCSADIHKFFTCVERSLTRGTVLAAGWMVSPGTINYNRRYVLLLSTGRLLIFKDASLDNLRRELWLGDSGCSISPVRELPQCLPGGPAERTWLDGLARAHEASRLYCEMVALRIVHPSLTDKKGYLLGVERLDAQESPAAHGARFREWLRVLQSAVRDAVLQNRRLHSVPDQFQEFSRKMASLRGAEESRQCLERMILAKNLSGEASANESHRAGNDHSQEQPKLCRAALDRLVAKAPHVALTSELVRVANFVVGVMSTGNAEKDLLLRETQVTEDACDILTVLVLGPFWAFHSAADPLASEDVRRLACPEETRISAADEGSTESRAVVCGSAALQVDAQIVLDIVRDLSPSFPDTLLQASRPIVCAWLRSLFLSDAPFAGACRRRIWDLVVVEIDSDDGMHLRDRTVQIAIVSIAMAARAASSPLHELTFEAWRKLLSHPEGGEATVDTDADELRADSIVFALTRDRELLRATRWTQLKERRSQLWNSLEVESRESAGLVNRWMATARSLDDLSHSVLDTLNKTNADEASRDRKVVSRLTKPVHAALAPLGALLREFMEVLQLAKLSLLQLTTRSAQATPALYAGTSLDRLLDESSGCSNLFYSASGQVSINPALVADVAKATLALGWAMAAACDDCIAFADTMAFHRVRMLSRCIPLPRLEGGVAEAELLRPLGHDTLAGSIPSEVDHTSIPGGSNGWYGTGSFPRGEGPDARSQSAKAFTSTQSPSTTKMSPTRRRTSPDFRSKSHSYSLSGVARLVRPQGDPKEASTPLAQRVYDDLCRLLHSLLIHVDDMAQCMVDTSVSSQRRRSEQSPLIASTVHPDPFGGRIEPLARLVPYIVRASDQIRSQALFADHEPET